MEGFSEKVTLTEPEGGEEVAVGEPVLRRHGVPKRAAKGWADPQEVPVVPPHLSVL